MDQSCSIFPVSAKKNAHREQTSLNPLTPHPNFNVGDRMPRMQRTEMKTPSFCNPHSLYSNTEIGGAGVAATVCGPFENMGVFSQTPVRSCSVIPPSLSIMHDSTRAMRVCVLSTSKKVSAQWTTRPLETVMSFGVKMNCFLCVVHQLCSVSSKQLCRTNRGHGLLLGWFGCPEPRLLPESL